MKQIILSSLCLWLLAVGCKKNSELVAPGQEDAASPPIVNRSCASADILAAQLAADPSLKARRDMLESFTQNVIKHGVNNANQATINIPVVVNVVYHTAAENISLQQIQSQIDVMNEDFNKRNADVDAVPAIYKPRVGNVGINFVLSSVMRRETNKKSWNANNSMKKTSAGGIDATDPEHKLNIWVCNLGQGLLGFAYYPNTISAELDGAVILYSAFGSRDKYPAGTYITNYDLGRTATHEIGHWMNLIHIWGDDGTSCNGTDMVDDTPNQAGENYGCPVFPTITCSNTGDMSMNYMDYTYDRCMFMFSKGQRDRSLACFVAGGPRAGYVQ